MSAASDPVKIAVLGCGIVGTQVIRLLLEQSADLAARVGGEVELAGVYVRDTSTPRDSVVPVAALTDDANALIDRSDVVVEVMGGIEPARTMILRALKRGAAVVTANKALLAERGAELYEAADEANADLYYEAAVAGAIPLVRPVRESLAGDRVTRILGIVNGTTNYVLDEMTTKGLPYDEVVAEAQRLGFAEADPTADVGGHDAAAKAAILASLAFHQRVGLDDVYCEGITEITPEDIAAATDSGHVIKLLAVAEQADAGVSVRVHPTLVPKEHPLAGVRGAYNAVYVEAEAAGDLMFYGQGAGGVPTASAVLGDIVSVARHKVSGGKGPRESNYAKHQVLPMDVAQTRYAVRMAVPDRPGVLAAVAAIFASHDVGIGSARQIPGENYAELMMSTHLATEAALNATVADLRASEVVDKVWSVLRVEGKP